MEKLPKNDIFQTPEDYFMGLPDAIFNRQRARKAEFKIWIASASAAAVLVLGLVFAPLLTNDKTSPNLGTSISEEIDFYIESGYFQAEDILTLSEDPNDILDEILSNEWAYDLGEENEEEGWWF